MYFCESLGFIFWSSSDVHLTVRLWSKHKKVQTNACLFCHSVSDFCLALSCLFSSSSSHCLHACNCLALSYVYAFVSWQVDLHGLWSDRYDPGLSRFLHVLGHHGRKRLLVRPPAGNPHGVGLAWRQRSGGLLWPGMGKTLSPCTVPS